MCRGEYVDRVRLLPSSSTSASRAQCFGNREKRTLDCGVVCVVRSPSPIFHPKPSSEVDLRTEMVNDTLKSVETPGERKSQKSEHFNPSITGDIRYF